MDSRPARKAEMAMTCRSSAYTVRCAQIVVYWRMVCSCILESVHYPGMVPSCILYKNILFFRAYLLIIRCIVNDVGHQNGEQFSDAVDASCKCSIGSCTARGLAGFACSFYPLPGYRVYDIEYAQLVGARCLLEVGVDLLNQDGFILYCLSVDSSVSFGRKSNYFVDS